MEQLDTAVVNVMQSVEPDVEQMAASFRRELEWRHRTPATIRTYMDGVARLDEFLVEAGMPRQVGRIRREHLEAFIADQLGKHKASTAKVRYGSIVAFFGWLTAEGEITADPTERMSPPFVMEEPVPIVADADLKKLLRACSEGPDDFTNRRDTALIRLLIARGPRLAELVGMKVTDIDLDDGWFSVIGKGRRPRKASLSRTSLAAMDRYMRARGRHPEAYRDQLWLSGKGILTASGVQQMLERRSAQAGIDKVKPHQLRHTSAARSRMKGVPDSSLRRAYGWSRGSTMVERYGSAADDEIAKKVFAAMEPDGDL
jgi:site-specific recombinase XerD